MLWILIDGLTGNGSIVPKSLRDPRAMKRPQIIAENIVQTAAFRPQHHLCPGTFADSSSNIIGSARLVSLVGPLVFIRFWLKTDVDRSVRPRNQIRSWKADSVTAVDAFVYRDKIDAAMTLAAACVFISVI
ncbi:MAG: hypothetical protein ABW003_12095 [Microvirga sp.]